MVGREGSAWRGVRREGEKQVYDREYMGRRESECA